MIYTVACGIQAHNDASFFYRPSRVISLDSDAIIRAVFGNDIFDGLGRDGNAT